MEFGEARTWNAEKCESQSKTPALMLRDAYKSTATNLAAVLAELNAWTGNGSESGKQRLAEIHAFAADHESIMSGQMQLLESVPSEVSRINETANRIVNSAKEDGYDVLDDGTVMRVEGHQHTETEDYWRAEVANLVNAAEGYDDGIVQIMRSVTGD